MSFSVGKLPKGIAFLAWNRQKDTHCRWSGTQRTPLSLDCLRLERPEWDMEQNHHGQFMNRCYMLLCV